MPEDLERSCKRVRYSTDMLLGFNKEVEDEIYVEKIMQLFEEKRKKFAREDALAAQIKETKKRKRPKVEKKKMKKKKKKKKKSERVRVPIVSNEITQRLKEYITNEMNGQEVKMVIQKPLFSSDLLKSQNRLNMPINQLVPEDFLTENEKQDLDNKKEFEVKLLGPRLKMHKNPMVMTKWRMKSSDNYVLKTNWNNFVKENEKYLKENTLIQVWSFRKDEKLHFAIACVEKDVDQQNDVADVDGQNDAPASSIPINLLPPKKRWKFQCSNYRL